MRRDLCTNSHAHDAVGSRQLQPALVEKGEHFHVPPPWRQPEIDAAVFSSGKTRLRISFKAERTFGVPSRSAANGAATPGAPPDCQKKHKHSRAQADVCANGNERVREGVVRKRSRSRDRAQEREEFVGWLCACVWVCMRERERERERKRHSYG